MLRITPARGAIIRLVVPVLRGRHKFRMFHKLVLAGAFLAIVFGTIGCASDKMDDVQYDHWAQRENDKALDGKMDNPNRP
jgi:hypothetical protein